MPRFNVEHDGMWACFSTIVEDFITPFMPLEKYEQWRDEEYGRSKCPLEIANRMDYDEALERNNMHCGCGDYEPEEEES